MQHIKPAELAQYLADSEKKQPLLLDVREPWEYETCHIPQAQLMPMHTVPLRFQELDPEASIVCVCHHGGRSMQVAHFLERNGFNHIINLTGGVHAWAKEVDTSMPTY
ncbi:MAG: sulfurtransferase [Burkholderiales bacterium]|nr:sulfurtransferase [Burkholderiales bacterium]